MRAHIDAGLAVLELTANELRTLFVAVNREAEHHLAEAALCENEAMDREEHAKTARRGRVASKRVAGELRAMAASHRAFYRDACDLRRVIARLTVDTSVR